MFKLNRKNPGQMAKKKVADRKRDKDGTTTALN